MTRNVLLGGMIAAVSWLGAAAEVVEYPGSSDPVAHQRFINVVSEIDSPVQKTYIRAKDGVYVAAAIRKPEGDGPFPALIVFHGAPGGRGMEQLVGWSRGDTGGPVWERFLQEGFVVAVADYRGGPYSEMNTPSTTGLTTAIDDGMSVVEYVRQLPHVDPARVSVYGVSLGGNLAMYLAAKVPELNAVVTGAPAPIWFLGCELPADRSELDFTKLRADPETSRANILPIRAPILVQVGTVDSLRGLAKELHDQLVLHGRDVRLEIYQHGYHDFVLGPQGQQRADLAQGEILLQGALDALDRSVQFVKAGAAARQADDG